METRVVQDEPDLGPAPSPRPNAIDIQGLTKHFGSVHALTDLNLSVPVNSIFGFLGPNGAGKTTTIKIILGLAKPTGGQAQIFGLDTVHDSLSIRRRIGYLAQEPHFYPHMTARETLEFTARFFYRGTKIGIRDRVDETLDLVGLSDRADRPIKGFSGGERQRLGLAQAQVNHPDLLILDEPAASLDPIGRRDVLEVMRRLKTHATIFYSTHILDDVQRVSDQVAILDRGRLVTRASTTDLLQGEGARYRVTVRGDAPAAASALRSKPWVSDVTSTDAGEATTVIVSVTDEKMAESELLATLLAAGAQVSDFGHMTEDLEEVFLRLIDRSGS